MIGSGPDLNPTPTSGKDWLRMKNRKFWKWRPLEILFTSIYFVLCHSKHYFFLLLGWIPGLEIDKTFLCERFFNFRKLELIQWITLIPGILKFWSNSLGIRIWKFRSEFEIAWVASICVGVLFSKSLKVLSFLPRSFSCMT